MRWFRSRSSKSLSFESHAPLGLVDLHSHVLPGLDDGARDMEEAIGMLDALAGLGFVKSAATPHFDNPAGEPKVDRQQGLIAALSERRNGRPPEVTVGAEIVFDDVFLRQEAAGAVPGIAANRTYLVEFGFLPGTVSAGLLERVFRFQATEKQLILAHPERLPDVQSDTDKAAALRRSGVLMQMDVMAIVGRYGRTARETAVEMLERGLYDIAATDLHHVNDIGMLQEALCSLSEWDGEVFNRLFSMNPWHVIEGRVEEIGSYA